uniref:Uncharacterized protein n=1 Tax=Vitis vinifera TaxID=29760 RepID=F6GTX2_VITVI
MHEGGFLWCMQGVY